MVFIPTLCSTCGSELQALKLNLYLGICIFFSATFCLVTLQNTDLASDTCNTGTGTGRRRDRTALQSPWKSVPCQFRWMGRKRQRIHGVVESSESALAADRVGRPAAPFLLLPPLLRSWLLDDGSSGGAGRREHKEPIRYSHTGAISACGPPSVRGPRGEEWRSSRVSRTNHPRAGATASSDPRRDPVAGDRRRERPAAVTAARERWLARSPTTGGGRCFIYRPPLGLREPSDGPRAAGSERTMAS